MYVYILVRYNIEYGFKRVGIDIVNWFIYFMYEYEFKN